MSPYARNLPLYAAYTVAAQARFGRAVFVLFLADRGLSWAEIGALQSALYLSNFLTEVPTGVFGDRFGRRVSVAAGLAVAVLVSCGQLAASSFPAFLGLFVLQGVGFSLVSGSDAALLYDSVRAVGRTDDYVRIRSRLQAAGAASMAVAMVVGGWVSGASWALVYAGSAVTSALALAAILAAREPPRSDDDEPEVGVGEAVRSFAQGPGRVILPLALASACLHAAMTPYYVFSQGAFASAGVPPGWIAAVFAAVEVASGAFGLSASRVAQRYSLAATMRFVLAATCAGLLASASGSAGVRVAVFVGVNGLLAVLVVLIDDHLQARVPSAARATVLSGYSFLEAAVTGGSYFAAGWVIEWLGTDLGLASLAILPAAAMVLAATYFRRPLPAT